MGLLAKGPVVEAQTGCLPIHCRGGGIGFCLLATLAAIAVGAGVLYRKETELKVRLFRKVKSNFLLVIKKLSTNFSYAFASFSSNTAIKLIMFLFVFHIPDSVFNTF